MRALVRFVLTHPVATVACWVLVTALGVAALVRMPLSLFPALDYPALDIYTAVPGAGPDRVEGAVTEVVEREVAGAEGIVGIEARSRSGASVIRLELAWDADVDAVLLAVGDRINRARERLPPDAERPVVLKADPSARPVLVAAVGAADLPDVRDVAGFIARRVEQVPGVARVQVAGLSGDVVTIRVDPARAAAYGIRAGQVQAALDAASASSSGGNVRYGDREYSVEVGSGLRTPAEIAAIPIVTEDRAVRLGQVATVTPGQTDEQSRVLLDGQRAVMLTVSKTYQANAVDVSDAATAALRAAAAQAGGVQVTVVEDLGRTVLDVFRDLALSLAFGGVLAVIVLLVFLEDFGTVVILAVSVPLSLAGALVMFEPAGLSLNLMSVTGLVLGVGMLIDNAIVVTENVARHREAGRSVWESAERGAGEVAAAIAASTATTSAVFLPLSLAGGLVGRVFREQSLAVVFSLVASLLVALTIVPLLSARLGAARPQPAPTRGRLAWAYEHRLLATLRRPLRTLGLAALAAGVGVAALASLPRSVLPDADGVLVRVRFSAPASQGFAGAVQAEAAIRGRAVGAYRSLSDIGRPPPETAGLSARGASEGVLTLMFRQPQDAQAFVEDPPPSTSPFTYDARTESNGVDLLLPGADTDVQVDFDRGTPPHELSAFLAGAAREPALASVRLESDEAIPALQITPRVRAAARYGLTVSDVSDAVRTASSGREIGRLRRTGDDTPVVLRADDLSFLDSRVQTAGPSVPLRELVQVDNVLAPAERLRVNQSPVERVLADFSASGNVETGVAAVQRAADGLASVPVVRGAGLLFDRGLQSVGVSLLLSLALVYLILAAQFNHVVQPLIVLAAVPLALPGVAAGLAVAGHTVNLMSLTGLVILTGIVVNDAIVKVDLFNQRCHAGLGTALAVLGTGRDRLRPILMTTVTTSAGLVPTALGLGGDINAPLASAIIGGILCSTALTLFVIPALYTALLRSS